MIRSARKFICRSRGLRHKFRTAVTLGISVLSACWEPVIAQLCTDPSTEVVFIQTFGTVKNPASLNGIATYEYDASNCPNDNKYTLSPSIDGTCFNSTWNAVAEDHTPNDVQGNMLIVNGGNKPGAFLQQPVSNLCKNSSYEVSFWAMNVLRVNTCIDPLIPNLSIRVETAAGDLIQLFPIGLIRQESTPVWRQYGATFTLPSTVDEVVIKLVNNQGDFGCGNDLALDDFQVKLCGTCELEFNPVFVPTAFTPNQDGVNDTLKLLMSEKPVLFNLKIFNRWGNLVFVSTDITHEWDGTNAGIACPADTYTWVAAYQTGTRTKRNHVQTGYVVLIR